MSYIHYSLQTNQVLLIAHDKQGLEHMVRKIQVEYEKEDLAMNTGKTKYVYVEQ